MANDPTKRFLTAAQMVTLAGEMKTKFTNQNAFSNITVGSDTIAAGSTTDTFELEAGSNVQLTTTGKKITVAATDTTYADVVAGSATSGLMTGADKSKLDGIEAGAEVNQNAFSNITVGATTIAADAKTDTLEIEAGTNITLTPDASNDKVTIAAADTTYSISQDADNGHIVILTPSTGQATSITIPDNDTTYSGAVASVSGVGGTDGLLVATDKEKLDGIAAGAQVNVLEGVQVNGTDLVASNKVVNVTVAEGATNGTVAVNGTDVAVHGLGSAAYATVETTGIASNGTTLATTAQVKSYVDGIASSAYKVAGTLTFAQLTAITPSAANHGNIYNVSDGFTTTSAFAEGAGGVYPAGTNVVIANVGTSESPSYKFDAQAGTYDLSIYQQIDDLGGLTDDEMSAIIAAL